MGGAAMTQEDQDTDRVRQAAEALGEHFDTVQILVTRHEEESVGTTNVCWGKGNWFARYGQVREWLLKSEERTKESIRKEDQ